jgi:hypothetical protein
MFQSLEQVDTHTHRIGAFGYGNFKRVICGGAHDSSLQVKALFSLD